MKMNIDILHDSWFKADIKVVKGKALKKIW